MPARLSTSPVLTVAAFGGSTDNPSPRIFVFGSTNVSTGITGTGFLAGHGEGGRTSRNIGLRRGDIVLHVSSTDAGVPGKVTLHSVIGSTANVASTSASSAFTSSFGYDCTLSGSSS
jgi:hypothetical protein